MIDPLSFICLMGMLGWLSGYIGGAINDLTKEAKRIADALESQNGSMKEAKSDN